MIRWVGKQDWLQMGYFKRVWILLYPWLLYEAVSTVVIIVYGFIIMLTDPEMIASAGDLFSFSEKLMEKIYGNYIPVSIAACSVMIPLLILFMRMDRKTELRMNMNAELWKKTDIPSFIWPFLCGVSACVVLNHVLIYSGLYELLQEGYEGTAEILFGGSFWLELLAVGILTPITEELIFRGLLYRRLRWSTDARFAIPASAFIFAVFHGNLLQGIYAFCIGILLAFLYERYHHLAAPVLVHVGANLISVVLTDGRILDFLYESDSEFDFIIFTIGMMLVFVAAFYIILTRIRPERKDLPAPASATQEGGTTYGA